MTPPARLLDITRLSSRIGRVFTGVDRVELAYLRAVHADDVPAFAIARSALGYILLDRFGIGRLLARIDLQAWPEPDFVSRINRRLDYSAKIGQTLLRDLAAVRCARPGLKRMLRRNVPTGFTYLNVGHSNLTQEMFTGLKEQKGTQISVLVHDTIPLDFPEYQRDGTVAVFKGKLRRASEHADIVICVSEAGKADVSRHMSGFGRVPDMCAAHLGLDVAEQEVATTKRPFNRPYFLTVGTIEPRKNHALLLDVWEHLGEEAPMLVICGQRGWNNQAVFDRLDAGIPNVVERNNLSDTEMVALMKGAQATLFPTFAEGFGLPPVESRALGTPVLVSDLPVLRETLQEYATYLDPNDVHAWSAEIMKRSDAVRSQGETDYDPPTWEDHFNIVFTMT